MVDGFGTSAELHKPRALMLIRSLGVTECDHIQILTKMVHVVFEAMYRAGYSWVWKPLVWKVLTRGGYPDAQWCHERPDVALPRGHLRHDEWGYIKIWIMSLCAAVINEAYVDHDECRKCNMVLAMQTPLWDM